MPRLGWDADEVTKEIGKIGHAVHDVPVDVEHLPARVGEIARLGRANVPGRDIDIGVLVSIKHHHYAERWIGTLRRECLDRP